MSKKINLFFLLISCLLFTSFSPSLDGRAVVADSGVLPEGYFAKTVGYLPGDSIIVSNFAAGKTLDILVVGSLDQSEGVAILLSPEAAAELGIVKNSNVIVKLTKRSGELDEAVSGTAVIAQGEMSLSSGMERNVTGEDARETITDETDTEENTEEREAEELISEAADDTERAEAALETAEAESDIAESDITEAEAISDERVTDEPVVTEAEGKEDERIAEETDAQSGDAADESEAVSETIAATEEEVFPDEKIIVEDIPEDVRERSEAIAEDIPAESETGDERGVTDEPVVTEVEIDETSSPTEERALAESVPPAEEAPAGEKIAVDVPPEEERDIASDTKPENDTVPAEEEKTEALIAETIESDKPVDDKAYSAIVLSNTDDSENSTESSVQTSAEVRTTESVQAESVSESEMSSAQSTVSSSSDLGTADSIAREYGVRTAENLSSLDKGKYYVQIASFANPSNIRETLAKYGRDYPVTLVPLASKATTQVMIGPLSVDEYAVVLERFKLYGYRDAFVRKIR